MMNDDKILIEEKDLHIDKWLEHFKNKLEHSKEERRHFE